MDIGAKLVDVFQQLDNDNGLMISDLMTDEELRESLRLLKRRMMLEDISKELRLPLCFDKDR